MSGSGLKELLELVYAPNAVTHMLSGKAVSRSVRGFMLVNIALHCLMTGNVWYKKMRFKESRTSNLWLSFCKMVAVLKRFLLAERTAD